MSDHRFEHGNRQFCQPDRLPLPDWSSCSPDWSLGTSEPEFSTCGTSHKTNVTKGQQAMTMKATSDKPYRPRAIRISRTRTRITKPAPTARPCHKKCMSV